MIKSDGRIAITVDGVPMRDEDGYYWPMTAPRYGDIVACPYCDNDTKNCDHCDGTGVIYASEFFPGDTDKCGGLQNPSIDGHGGSQPLMAKSHPYTTVSLTQDSFE